MPNGGAGRLLGKPGKQPGRDTNSPASAMLMLKLRRLVADTEGPANSSAGELLQAVAVADEQGIAAAR